MSRLVNVWIKDYLKNEWEREWGRKGRRKLRVNCGQIIYSRSNFFVLYKSWKAENVFICLSVLLSSHNSKYFSVGGSVLTWDIFCFWKKKGVIILKVWKHLYNLNLTIFKTYSYYSESRCINLYLPTVFFPWVLVSARESSVLILQCYGQCWHAFQVLENGYCGGK